MKLQITAEGMDLTPSIKTQIEKKIGEGLDKYLDGLNEDIKTADVKVDYFAHKERFSATFNIALPDHHHIYAEAENGNIDKVLTALREEAERQLLKLKEKSGK